MLRFWGTEFEQLEASKSGTGQRLYSREQVELILEIRRLLFDEGLTIAGARKRVGALAGAPRKAPAKEAETTADEDVAEPEAAAPAREEADPAPLPPPKADKAPTKDLRPVLSTLRGVRDEVAAIVDDLRK
jgi:DNA-binding transcriptional MerR regulator